MLVPSLQLVPSPWLRLLLEGRLGRESVVRGGLWDLRLPVLKSAQNVKLFDTKREGCSR